MKYKKRNIKYKKILIIILLFVCYFYLLIHVRIPSLSLDTMKKCLSSALKRKDETTSNVFLNKEVLLKKALPYIETKGENIENNGKNEEKVEKNENNLNEEISILNETKYNVDVQSVLFEKPHFNINKNKPLILIIHTHTSESYQTEGKFETLDNDRTLDNRYNMVRIGEEFEKVLTENGINVIHDKTLHDYPSYSNSYKRSLETVEAYLKKYPSIQIVLDIHRDALGVGNKTVLKTNINGKDTAQVMIVCGTNESGLDFDGWEDNLRFAMQLQNTMQKDYPTLSRPITLSRNRYNMHKTKGSLLFEIGTNTNTLSEAVNGAHLMANSLVKTIKSCS